jgi:hypothetical protein
MSNLLNERTRAQELEDRVHEVWNNAYHAGLSLYQGNKKSVEAVASAAILHAEQAAKSYETFFRTMFAEPAKATAKKSK